MVQSIVPRIGWAWSIRVLGFVLIIPCSLSVMLCSSRVPPRKGHRTTWQDTLPDLRIFLDGTGAMVFTTAGFFLTDLAYLVPMTYIPSYYLDRQGIPPDQTLTSGAAFAYQLLAISNAASCVGRYVAGDMADRFGRYNTMIVSLSLCLTSTSCFFLPDALSPGLQSTALLVTFVVLFGFVSGSNVSLAPICLGQLCETQEYGRYFATSYTVASFGCLISIPIAGGLLDVSESEGRRRYTAAIGYTSASYLVAVLCFLWVRLRIKGWNWSTKW